MNCFLEQDPKELKKFELEEILKRLIEKYPEYDDENYDEEFELTSYEDAVRMCVNLYKIYDAIFVPHMIGFPKGNFILESYDNFYGHTHYEYDEYDEYDNCGKEKSHYRVWSPIKFTISDIFNREISGKMNFTSIR